MSKYVVFDGMDGSGKGTQLALLEKMLGSSTVFTREPGGTPFAEKIRALVRDDPLAGGSTALNNFLLFWAAREELQQNIVSPTLQAGKHVFSDRGDSSTFAFQIHGENDIALLGLFNIIRGRVFGIRGRRAPDLYVIFDLPPQVARDRVKQDTSRMQNHFDMRDLEYYARVRYGFRKFAVCHPVVFIDATKSKEEIHRSVVNVLVKRGVIQKPALALE